MPQPADQNCGNCRYMIDTTYTDGNPRCHRYPPQSADETEFGDPPTYMKFEYHVWRFPKIEKSMWCGEWQPND